MHSFCYRCLFLGILFSTVLNCDPLKPKAPTTLDDIASVDHISLDRVKAHFKKNYLIRGQVRIQFEKQLDGWYVGIVDRDKAFQSSEIDRELYWDGDFHDLSFSVLDEMGENESAKDANLENRLLKKDKASTRRYRFFPTYGYSEWHEDLIDAVDEDHPITDSVAFVLGQAYGKRAFEIARERFEGEREQSHPEGTWNSFRSSIERASTLFDTVESRDPDFEAFIGSIMTEAANQRMEGFMEIWASKGIEAAEELLEDVRYPAFLRSAAINRLKSCDSNAVLLTSGDNDTYPLWYVQFEHDIRPDVKVINVSLLYKIRYLRAFWEPYLNTLPLEHDLPLSVTRKLQGKLLKLKDLSKADTQNGIHDLEENLERFEGKLRKEVSADSQIISSSVPNAFKIDLGEDTLYGTDLNRLLDLRELKLLELYAEAGRGQPVNVVTPFALHNEELLFKMGDQIQKDVLIHKLEPSGTKPTLQRARRCHELFIDVYTWEGVERIRRSEEINFFVNHIYELYKGVGGFLEADEDLKKARDLMTFAGDSLLSSDELLKHRKIVDWFPSLASQAYDLGKAEQGDRLVKRTFEALDEHRSAWDKEKREAILQRLTNKLKEHDREEMIESFEEAEKADPRN